MSTKNLKRHKQIIVRVTPEEKDFIMKKVDKSGHTLNFYALMMMTVGSIKNIDLSHYHELAAEINKIGVNINQIAHVINSTNRVFDWEIKQLQERMDEIWQLLKSSLSELQSTSR